MTGLVWLALLTIVIMCYYTDKFYHGSYSSSTGFVVGCTGFIAAIVLAATLIAWPVFWYQHKEFKAEYEATKETIEITRTSDCTEYERAALTHKIIEFNQKIAIKKYWNDGLWDWYTPDDVANLEPLH